jgi:hypothetical protein
MPSTGAIIPHRRRGPASTPGTHPPLLGGVGDVALELCGQGGDEGRGVRAPVARVGDRDRDALDPVAVGSEAEAAAGDHRRPVGQREHGRAGGHGGRVAEDNDRHAGAGQVPIADDRDEPALAKPAAQGTTRLADRHEVDHPGSATGGEELVQGARLDLLDRRERPEPMVGEERPERLEVAEVPRDEDRGAPHDGLRHRLPARHLDDRLDLVPPVVRRTQQLEVVARVVAERGAHHGRERGPRRRPAGGRADAREVG